MFYYGCASQRVNTMLVIDSTSNSELFISELLIITTCVDEDRVTDAIKVKTK